MRVLRYLCSTNAPQPLFLPFISPPPNPNTNYSQIFFKNVMAREEALATLTKVMREEGASMEISVAQIFTIHTYEPKTFGLDVPEPVVREAYIMRPDLSPIIGWETGRPSVPFFMELNLEAVRGSSLPRVVLYQLDLGDPMNPHGLLIAYAEAVPTPRVLPVCSDFDTFTVGSKGMLYALTHTTAALPQPLQ